MKKIIKDLSEKDFEKYILNNKKYVLVDFWAVWCAPCKVLSIVLKDIFNEYNNKLDIIKLDIEKNSNITKKYSIQSVPTLILFKNNKILSKNIGSCSKEKLKIFLNQHIK
ncbi:MAG: thioredoxin [Buchnera aphidicola (Periphyllus acericola)]|uniref:thioredoxin n=1 Tax=Buchnera aphidicola TaxID=9 RepID=UPI0030D5C1B7|nr:thioredoxin [Buchnera aphidicola (Periphyllus acericola)]